MSTENIAAEPFAASTPHRKAAICGSAGKPLIFAKAFGEFQEIPT
jgi:hypothetical protein